MVVELDSVVAEWAAAEIFAPQTVSVVTAAGAVVVLLGSGIFQTGSDCCGIVWG